MRIRINNTSNDNASQICNLGLTKKVLTIIEEKMMLGQKRKNLSEMLVVKLRGCVEHQDIVKKKDYETFAQKRSKKCHSLWLLEM